MRNFVHLHCHSEYSLLDGAVRVREMTRRAADLGMPAVALTDHGNMHGAVEFYREAQAVGVKPILGMEAYVSPRPIAEKKPVAGRENYSHMTLLAATDEGYRNLVKLSTAGHLEGFYYKPRVDRELIGKYRQGLIALSGCLRSDLNMRILAGDTNGARSLAAEWKDLFGAENYFIELHDHGFEAQERCNPILKEIAAELSLGVVAANDVHFLDRAHHESHDILLCIGTGSRVVDTKRMRYSEELYFKTPEEMEVLFPDVPEALEATLAIAERCNVTLEFDKPKYPIYEPPPNVTREGYLRKLCQEGLRKRYGGRASSDPELTRRLEYELSVIEKTGFVSYFLIVWDFIHFARTHGIPVGPGRGSAAGSLIAYALEITDIDPLRFGLLFERFLNPDLRAALDSQEATRQLWDHAVLLEGLGRNTGVHAAGVVIGDRPLDEYIPLCRGKDEEVVTQYEMGALTQLGLLKMDFLGLKTLTVIASALRLIREKDPSFDLDAIPPDDPEAFGIYNRGETIGVFQMESGGLTTVCKKFDIRSVEEIIALNALYRPGPMQFIDDFIARKKGQKKIEYIHPLLEKVCAETYGIIVYQEQVQMAANVLAGYTLGEADILRRAMGKKDAKQMANERKRFIEGCKTTNNIPEKVAEAIFGFIEKFAQYGFNKSHSAAYGWVSYQTAYLKAHYPVELMAALLTHDASTTDRLGEIITECRRMAIPILPPCINKSGLEFTPVKTPEGWAIRFSLASVKNVGKAAMTTVLSERSAGGPFKSLDDFCSRVDSRTVNRRILESLIRCGAFDTFGGSRAQLFVEIESAMASAAAIHRDRSSGQGGLFDDMELASKPGRADVPLVEPWSKAETLAHEKELLGFYVTDHPLADYQGHFDSGKLTPIGEVLKAAESGSFKIGGILTSMEKRFTKKDGRPFGAIVIEDFTGSIEVTAWDEVFSKNAELLIPGAVLGAGIRATLRDDSLRVTATSFGILKPRAGFRPIRLRLAHARLTPALLEAIAAAARDHPGRPASARDRVRNRRHAYARCRGGIQRLRGIRPPRSRRRSPV